MALVSATTRPDAEWHEWRRQGIGGSDAGAICGLSPWKGALTVWLEKTGRLQPERKDSEWLRWGKRMEGPIAEEFEDRTGLVVAYQGCMVEGSPDPWQRATLDGLVFESPEDAEDHSQCIGVLEMKTSSWRSPLGWSQGVPKLYSVQVQHELMVTGELHAWLVVLHDGSRLEIHEIERDPDAINLLREIEGDFWECVQSDTPPPADLMPSTERAVKAAFPIAEPTTVVLSGEARQWLDNYLATVAVKDNIEKTVAQAKGELMLALGSNEVGTDAEGNPLITWKNYKTTSLDTEALRAEMPDIAKRYTRTSNYRRFVVKSPKEPG